VRAGLWHGHGQDRAEQGTGAEGANAASAEGTVSLHDGARPRRVRMVRDYGMFDRREVPQYYPDVRSSHTERS